MAFEQRMTMLTLGVADLGRARAFYESLGWTASSASQGDWGGYVCYFADPDGHPWEIAFVETLVPAVAGSIRLP